jgi:hypothetical protein
VEEIMPDRVVGTIQRTDADANWHRTETGELEYREPDPKKSFDELLKDRIPSTDDIGPSDEWVAIDEMGPDEVERLRRLFEVEGPQQKGRTA